MLGWRKFGSPNCCSWWASHNDGLSRRNVRLEGRRCITACLWSVSSSFLGVLFRSSLKLLQEPLAKLWPNSVPTWLHADRLMSNYSALFIVLLWHTRLATVFQFLALIEFLQTRSSPAIIVSESGLNFWSNISFDSSQLPTLSDIERA